MGLVIAEVLGQVALPIVYGNVWSCDFSRDKGTFQPFQKWQIIIIFI